ncbi:hypothetical protein Cgig2_029219 [Carnegiea gigantea]|uniref:Uncharacterized protein n=1 Tax=Carnegiea gigantea TaxID=171969 RepID=A0A9Q1JP55_9CARY|nr:hypothetical protein Cgig2_029219 [Carnegiea gigantea]
MIILPTLNLNIRAPYSRPIYSVRTKTDVEGVLLRDGWESLDTVIAAESLSMTLQSMGKLRDARELLERPVPWTSSLCCVLLVDESACAPSKIGANMLRLANVALLSSRQLKDSTISEVIVELDKAKELLTHSTRFENSGEILVTENVAGNRKTAINLADDDRICRQPKSVTGNHLKPPPAQRSERTRESRNCPRETLSFTGHRELALERGGIAQQILDSTRKKKNIRNYEQRIGRDGQTALAILLQSLKALADVAIAKQEMEETGEALHVFEAEKTLRQCICAFKEYEVGTSNSTSIDLKAEYHSCLKQLLNLITKNGEQSRTVEVEELKGELRHLEAQITSHRRP